MNENPQHPTSFWKSSKGLALLSLLIVLAFYLLMEHTQHVFGALPYLLLLACPLLHFFGHGGHGPRSH